MADYVEKLILDDSQFVSGLKDVIETSKKAEQGFSDLKDEVSESQKQIGKEVTDTSKKIDKANQDTAKSHRAETEELKKKVGQYKLFGVSLDDVKQKLSGYMTSLKGVLASMTSFASLSEKQSKGIDTLTSKVGGGRAAFVAMAKSLNVFKVALAATGIGALLIALGSLVSFLTQTQKGMDLVERATTAVGVVFSKLSKAAAGLGEDIINAFQNPLQALKDLGESIKNFILNPIDSFRNLGSSVKSFVTDVVDAVATVDDLTVQLQKLRREQAENNVEFAKQRAEIERLKKISDDYTKSYAVRTAATQKAGQMEIEIANKKASMLAKEIELLQQVATTKQNDDLDAVKLEIQQKQLEYYDLINDSAGKQTELQNMLNGLLKEQQDYLKGATEQLFELGKQWNLITGADEFEFVKKEQIAELEKMKNTLEDISKVTKVDVSAQLEIINIGISELAKREFVPEVEKLEREIKPLEIKVRPQVEIGEVNLTAPEIDWSNFMGGIDSFSDLLDSALDEIFGSVTGEKARNFINASGQIIKDFSNIAAEAGRIAVENIDKQLDKIAERRQVLESDLDYELQLQSEGLANSASAKQEEVNVLLAEEERLTKEREKLQREQQRRQLAAETATQAAALVTSSINIIKGSVQFLGPAGLAVAIPVIASMFAFFAKTKADAFKATRLHTGADKVSDYFGFADRYGDTDLPGRGNGYKVVSSKTGRDTGVIISGREMIVPEKFSIPNQEFFTNLRMGHYDGIDLDSAIRFSQSFKQQNTTSRIVERQVIQPQQKQKQRVLLQVSDKKYTVVTIDENMRDGQIIEIDI